MIALQPAVFRQERKRPPVSSRLPVAVMFDNFNGTDEASASGRVPPVTPNANTWTVVAGSWVMLGGYLECRFDAASSGTLTFDIGKADFDARVTVIFPTAAANRSAAITFRRTNTTNFWYLSANASTGNLAIVEVTANVTTTRAVANFGFSANVPYTIRLVCQGDSILGSVEGVGSVSYTSSVRNTSTVHGLRATNTITTGGPIKFNDMIFIDPPPLADVVITVNSSPLLTSAFRTAVSHVSPNDLAFANATARARAEAALAPALSWHRLSCHSFGGGDPWSWDGTGTRPADPTNWGTLDAMAAMVERMGGTIVMGFGNWPWHIKGIWDGTTTTPMVPADSLRDTGRPYTEKLGDALHFVQKVCERYMVAPHNVRHWQMGIWEFHGLFVGRDGTFNHYAYHDYAGSPGQADMGMAYIHNQVAQKIIDTAATLGIARNQLTIITNYVPTPTPGTITSFAMPVGNPMRGQVWGNLDKRASEAILGMLPLLDPALWDVWSMDMGIYYIDGVIPPEATDWNAQTKFSDISSYFMTQVAALGYGSKRFWISEIYPKPVYDPGPNSQVYRAALAADAYMRIIKIGVETGIIWSTIGRANEPGLDGDAGLHTDASSSSGGQPQAMLGMVKVLHDYFSAGTPIYDHTIVSGTGISAIFSATKGYLINQSATPKTVSVDNVVYSLAAYENKVIDR